MNRNVKLVLIVSIPLALLLTGVLTMSMTESFTTSSSTKIQNYRELNIDPLTIILLTKSISLDDIPVKKYIQIIDSLNQQSNLGKSYNPFVERPKVRPKIVKKKISPSQTVLHRVERGQCLSRIAKVYGVSVDDIAAVNNIRNYHRIYIGQKLTIPGSSTPIEKRIIRPRVTVNGIIWDEFEPYAILNGEIYRVGDELKGYIIQSITDSTIVFVSSKDSFISKYKREYIGL